MAYIYQVTPGGVSASSASETGAFLTGLISPPPSTMTDPLSLVDTAGGSNTVIATYTLAEAEACGARGGAPGGVSGAEFCLTSGATSDSLSAEVPAGTYPLDSAGFIPVHLQLVDAGTTYTSATLDIGLDTLTITQPTYSQIGSTSVSEYPTPVAEFGTPAANTSVEFSLSESYPLPYTQYLSPDSGSGVMVPSEGYSYPTLVAVAGSPCTIDPGGERPLDLGGDLVIPAGTTSCQFYEFFPTAGNYSMGLGANAYANSAAVCNADPQITASLPCLQYEAGSSSTPFTTSLSTSQPAILEVS